MLCLLLLAGVFSANARSPPQVVQYPAAGLGYGGPWVKDVVVEKYGGKVELHQRAGPVKSKPRSNSIYKYNPKHQEERPAQIVSDYHEEKEHDPFALIEEMEKLNPSESMGRHPIQQEPLHRRASGGHDGSRPIEKPVRFEDLWHKFGPSQHEAYRPSYPQAQAPSQPYKTLYGSTTKYGSSSVNENYRPSVVPAQKPSYKRVASPSYTHSYEPSVKYGSYGEVNKPTHYQPEQSSHYQKVKQTHYQPKAVEYGSSSEPSHYQPEQSSHYPTEKPAYYQPKAFKYGSSSEPTHYSTEKPTHYPTEKPTHYPTEKPTYYPTEKPTYYPTEKPTLYPTENPTLYPTEKPTYYPTENPTYYPTEKPTHYPTEKSTLYPTEKPTYYQPNAFQYGSSSEEVKDAKYDSGHDYNIIEVEDSYPEQPSHYPEQPSHYPEQPSHYPEQPSHYPEQPSHYPKQQQQQSSDRTGHSAAILYKKPEDKCHEYTRMVGDAIELLDAKNSTCKEQYQQLRRKVDDRTIFDYCLEAVFIRDEVYGDVGKNQRDGKLFGFDFDLDFNLWGGDKDKSSSPIREEPWYNDWNDDSWCRPNQFCRRCTRRGSCCRRFCARMFYDTDLDYYSCRPQYCDKYSSSSRCRKCRHCYCNERY